MAEPYSVIDVHPEMRGELEQLGSKPKFWFKYEGHNWLFKEARENTGEDWSEKVASEIATLMGLSTHHTELASWQGKRGCAVKSFLVPKQEVLIHGNELLGGLLKDYDTEKVRGQSDHTFENIVKVILKLPSPPKVSARCSSPACWQSATPTSSNHGRKEWQRLIKVI